MIKTLSAEEVEQALTKLPGWDGDTGGLRKTLHFETFGDAMRFMTECAPGIDQRNHHPVWENKFNRVTIFLTTFDAGSKTTERDIDLAKFMNEVAKAFELED